MYLTIAFIASVIAATCILALLYALSRIRKLESAIDRLAAHLSQDTIQVSATPRRGLRRWLSFRTSTLLVVIAFVGCTLGIFAHEREGAQRQAAAVQRLKQVGATVGIRDTLPDEQPGWECGWETTSETFPPPTWIRYAFGEHFGCRIHHVVFQRDNGLMSVGNSLELGSLGCNDEDLATLSDLRDLRELNLENTNITDDALRYVGSVISLRSLSLRNTSIDGSGLRHLHALRDLCHLDLRGTNFREKHLAELLQLPGLRSVCLPHQATDSWVEQIAACETLRAVDFEDTAVSPSGLRHISKLPNLTCVYLSKASSNARGVNQLRAIDSLRILRLSGEALTPDDLKAIASLRQVKDLDLGSYFYVNGDEEAKSALSLMQHLKFLRITHGGGSGGFPGDPIDLDLPNADIRQSVSRKPSQFGGGVF